MAACFLLLPPTSTTVRYHEMLGLCMASRTGSVKGGPVVWIADPEGLRELSLPGDLALSGDPV